VNSFYFDKAEHRYYENELKLKEYPSVSKVLSESGFALPDIPKHILMLKSNLGTSVHKLLELDDKHQLGKYNDRLDSFLRAGRELKQEEDILEYDLIEQPLISKEYEFGGTPDRLSSDLLIDYKTGEIYPKHFIQQGGYCILIKENFGKEVFKIMLVKLFEDGNKMKYTTKDINKFTSLFLNCLEIYKYKKELKYANS